MGETLTNISDEIPFDLPENWAYSRLETIITLLSGRDLEPNQYNSQRIGMPYITGASNIENGSLIVNRWTTNSVAISHKYDLLITCKGTVGTMAFNNIGDVHIQDKLWLSTLTAFVWAILEFSWNHMFLYCKTKLKVSFRA